MGRPGPQRTPTTKNPDFSRVFGYPRTSLELELVPRRESHNPPNLLALKGLKMCGQLTYRHSYRHRLVAR